MLPVKETPLSESVVGAVPVFWSHYTMRVSFDPDGTVYVNESETPFSVSCMRLDDGIVSTIVVDVAEVDDEVCDMPVAIILPRKS